VMAKRNWTNQEVASLLKAMSAAYEVKNENKFKVIAYDRAATSIEHLATEIKDLWDEKKINQIPGVGANITQHLNELFTKGKSKHFQRAMKDLPPAMFELIKLSGVGPKTALKLCRHLGVWKKTGALKRIKRAAEKEKIRLMPGFGKKSEMDILKAISTINFKKEERRRMLLPYAHKLAQKIISYLNQSPDVREVQPLGSLRRQCATIGDIDLAVKTKKPTRVINHFLGLSLIGQILAKGEKKATVILQSGVQVDLRTQSPETWGSMLQYFTGSKHHNISLREFAQKKKLSLSEYGIKNLKNNKLIKSKTEKDFYKAIGISWIPPEIRECRGEIKAAQKNKLPQLVTIEKIKGDLHLHSNLNVEPSHDLGENTMETMVRKAVNMGYRYIGFTEHNPSISNHSPRKIISILSRKKDEVDKINRTSIKKFNIRILNGLEVDILSDGSLAIPPKGLELLDYAIVSVHSSFNQSQRKMTRRILSALENPKARILGHPTGRKLGAREGYELNWEKIFDFFSKHNKILEINAFPDRLDLPDFLAREAILNGVKMIINTDSHQVSHMELMKYGVAVARRGWAEDKDIINTYPFNKLCEIMNIKVKEERG